MEQDNIIVPQENASWPGPETAEGPDITHARKVKQIWDAQREGMLQQQRELNAKLDKQRTARAAAKKQRVDADNKKRKAESQEGPAAKRARTLADAQAQAQAQAKAQQEAARLAQQLERDRQAEKAEKRKAEQEKIQEQARIAAETRRALEADRERLAKLSQAQREKAENELAERTRKEQELKKQQEDKEMGEAGDAYNQGRLHHGLPPIPELSPLSDEQKQQEEQDRKDRQARLEEQRKKDELKKQEEEQEQQRERELQKKREEADRKRKEEAEAEKQKKEKADKELEAARAVLAKKYKDQEEQRKKLNEMKAKKAAEEKAKQALVERNRREDMFRDHFGASPEADRELDEYGLYVDKDNIDYAPPTNKSPWASWPTRFEDLTPAQAAQMQKMQEWQLNDLLDYMRRAGASTSQELTAEAQLARDVERAKALSLLTNDIDKAIFDSARLTATQNTATFKEARERLEQKAKSENISATEYVTNLGFAGVVEYLNTVLWPAKPEGYPRILGNPERPANVLLIARYCIRRDAREGIAIRARLEGRTVDEIVLEKGHASLEEYLQTLSDSLTMNDVLSDTANVWVAFNKRITDAGEWDARARALLRPAPGQITRNGKVYAVL